MEMYDSIKEIVVDILDVDPDEITPETYLVRELNAESIDMMELAVVLADQMEVEVDEEVIFLRYLRDYLAEAKEIGINSSSMIAEKYPFLSPERIEDILGDLDDGPVLQIKDIVAYIEYLT